MIKMDTIQYGKYQHYRTENLYEIIGIARHSETHEEMVVYKALYQCEKFGLNQIWVRSKSMFFEQVLHNGCKVPRFKWISE
jgi:hypothetical protein